MWRPGVPSMQLKEQEYSSSLSVDREPVTPKKALPSCGLSCTTWKTECRRHSDQVSGWTSPTVHAHFLILLVTSNSLHVTRPHLAICSQQAWRSWLSLLWDVMSHIHAWQKKPMTGSHNYSVDFMLLLYVNTTGSLLIPNTISQANFSIKRLSLCFLAENTPMLSSKAMWLIKPPHTACCSVCSLPAYFFLPETFVFCPASSLLYCGEHVSLMVLSSLAPTWRTRAILSPYSRL